MVAGNNDLPTTIHPFLNRPFLSAGQISHRRQDEDLVARQQVQCLFGKKVEQNVLRSMGGMEGVDLTQMFPVLHVGLIEEKGQGNLGN